MPDHAEVIVFLSIDVQTFHRTLQQVQLQMTIEICLLHESKHAKEKTNITTYTFKSIYDMRVNRCATMDVKAYNSRIFYRSMPQILISIVFTELLSCLMNTA